MSRIIILGVIILAILDCNATEAPAMVRAGTGRTRSRVQLRSCRMRAR